MSPTVRRRVISGLGLRNGLLVMGCLVLVLCTGCEQETVVPSVPTTSAPEAASTAVSTLTPTATLTPTPTPTRRATSTSQPTSTATPTPRPRPTNPSPAELATRHPELATILNNPEIDSLYKELAAAYQERGREGALALARERGVLTAEGELRVDLMLDTTDTGGTVDQLQSMGIRVVGTEGNRVRIAVPQSLLMAGGNEPGPALNALSGLDHVTGVAPPW